MRKDRDPNIPSDEDHIIEDFVEREGEVVLREYPKGGRRPQVYLLWKRFYGANIDQSTLVAVCTNFESASRRLEYLNRLRKETILDPVIFRMESAEVNHIFASIEQSYDFELDRNYGSMARTGVGQYMADRELNLELAASERLINSLQQEVAELKVKIAQLEKEKPQDDN